MAITPAPTGRANRVPVRSSSYWGRWRAFRNLFWQSMSLLAAVIAIVALGFILIYLLLAGFHAMNLSILTKGQTPMGVPGGGLRDSIVGTLILIGLASCIGLPFGILGGVYQIEAKGPFPATVRFLTDVLNSIPSIVIGLFVYVLVVVPSHHFSTFAGAIALGLLMIPTVMRTTEEILRLVPNTLREASLALGAPRWRTMMTIILPSARGGIITGIMLALSRIAGETAPLVLTAFGNIQFSTNLNKPISALPLTIYNDVMSPYDYLHSQAEAAAILLIVLILITSLTARYAARGIAMENK